jgi:hypothetical protein
MIRGVSEKTPSKPSVVLTLICNPSIYFPLV